MLHHLDALAIAKHRQSDFEQDAKAYKVSRAESKAEKPVDREWSGAAVRRRPATA